MSPATADVLVCGAGMCGISAAYHLAVKQEIGRVVLVDERAPMSFTSDKSTECYRNWWPGPGDTMLRFMNRSIDLLEALALESSNYFNLNRRGYVFLTADPHRAEAYERSAVEISRLGAGPLRVHRGLPGDPAYTPSPAEGFLNLPAGADLVLDPALIQRTFPFVSQSAVAMLHIRRCGWLSAQQLGIYLLEQAALRNMQLIRGKVASVEVQGGRVRSVLVETPGGSQRFHTDVFVNAAGPFVKQCATLVGVDLPVYNELHAKVAIQDYLGVVPYGAPLMLWDDPVQLQWNDEERKELVGDQNTRWLLETFPSGVHFRPEGKGQNAFLLGLWTYDIKAQEPVPEPSFDPYYSEVILRGLIHMIPGLSSYVGRMRKPRVDGGYYCKTRENRPLIGPTPVEGAFLFGAVSGFGIMAGMAGGELLAAHVAGTTLPDYAKDFLLSRYQDPDYQRLLVELEAASGQL
jgi:glycine/D-amino acid oxidase-like deaminating enzyme